MCYEQGDPLSPYIFLLAVEVLAISVRNEGSVNNILNEETKILQFADDTTGCLADEVSLQHFLNIFK